MCLGLATGYAKHKPRNDEIAERALEIISKQRAIFRIKNHREPEYVKLPRWIAEEIGRYKDKYLRNNDIEIDSLLGMKACPAWSLTELTEIEVF